MGAPLPNEIMFSILLIPRMEIRLYIGNTAIVWMYVNYNEKHNTDIAIKSNKREIKAHIKSTH